MGIGIDQAMAQLRALPEPALAALAPQIMGATIMFGLPDHLLLAALCWRETNAGTAKACVPKGEACTGDFGHGRGYWQIDDRAHPGFVNAFFYRGTRVFFLWRRKEWNATAAAQRLRDALDWFNGAEFPAIASYNCGEERAAAALAAVPAGASDDVLVAALDAVTTENYVSGVLAIRSRFRAAILASG